MATALRRETIAFARRIVAVLAVAMASCATSGADPGSGGEMPSDDQLIRPLPVVVVKPTNWVPKFPFPYDKTRHLVTEADINAERELCQWYTPQYGVLIDQIDRLQFNRLQQNGPGIRTGAATDSDYSFGSVQQQADIVTGNIDRSMDFITPRVQAFTINNDYAGDIYLPLFQAHSFYVLWQNLGNVNNGIKAHQPDWFTGPSVQLLKRAGSEINRSHVCW
ncbi:hypothetical protein BRW65_01150 [Mycobacterium paraffinicum]|uniref:Uncharacterized protein n=2 Tax=Mycobacterium paraffinicum TaxID=53378 RepID=A0A1Q4I289_9MYCO|nr:hypothetical protein BRW65_01150 [Mycobacterium paraffinicum]